MYKVKWATYHRENASNFITIFLNFYDSMGKGIKFTKF